MSWAEISIQTTNEAVEAIANLLHEAGSNGVVTEDIPTTRMNKDGDIERLENRSETSHHVVLKGYLLVTADLDQKLDHLKKSIDQLEIFGLNPGSKQMTVQTVAEKDWENEWKQYYKPIKVSKNIVITPTWERYIRENEEEHVIKLDPGMAFGTGTHPSTILSIQALEKTLKTGDRVLDVGTGTGILSIVSSLLGAHKVIAYDLDEVAIRSAKENISLNGQQQKVTVKLNNLLHGQFEKANIVVGNLLANLVVQLSEDVPNVLDKDGFFISSGIIKKQQQKVETALISKGFQIQEVLHMEDWIAIIATCKR